MTSHFRESFQGYLRKVYTEKKGRKSAIFGKVNLIITPVPIYNKYTNQKEKEKFHQTEAKASNRTTLTKWC
ncbi:hypothetical protein Gasu2_25780 [Galdieria sulphuraria]|nr:hypothetical protein Gasu2_25780 [Galdieria sulphuraria]